MNTLPRLFLLTLVSLTAPHLLSAQSIFEREVDNLAASFRVAADDRLVGHHIAIGDILDTEGRRMELGQQLAEELTFALQGSSDQFKIVDRRYFQQLMDEVDLGQTGLLDERSVRRLGRMQGVSAVVFGQIYQQANSYRVYLKVSHLETQTVSGLVRGNLSRTAQLDGKYRNLRTGTNGRSVTGNPTPVSVSSTGNGAGSAAAPAAEAATDALPVFSQGPLRLTFIGCAAAGRSIDCQYSIASAGRNESLTLYRDGTYLEVNGRKLSPQQLFLDGKRSSYQVNTSVRPGRPSTATIRYRNPTAGGGGSGALVLHAKSPSTYDFKYGTPSISF